LPILQFGLVLYEGTENERLYVYVIIRYRQIY
jgi:hypothetical protein